MAEKIDPVFYLAKAVQLIADRMPALDVLRTDHPLMGQTFEGLADAIVDAGVRIEAGLNNIARAVDSLKNRE